MTGSEEVASRVTFEPGLTLLPLKPTLPQCRARSCRRRSVDPHLGGSPVSLHGCRWPPSSCRRTGGRGDALGLVVFAKVAVEGCVTVPVSGSSRQSASLAAVVTRYVEVAKIGLPGCGGPARSGSRCEQAEVSGCRRRACRCLSTPSVGDATDLVHGDPGGTPSRWSEAGNRKRWPVGSRVSAS